MCALGIPNGKIRRSLQNIERARLLEVDLNTLPGLWVFAAPLKRTITIARSGAEERVNFRLGTFVWEPLIGNLGRVFSFGEFALETSF